MTISPDSVERAERQARIEEDIRRLFARYRSKPEPERAPERRFVPKRSGAQRMAVARPPKPRA